jgi:hypothetical protein
MMMVILNNDLANVIQAERRREAACERLLDDLAKTTPDPAARFTLKRLRGAWLRVLVAGRPPVLSAFRRHNPSSLESV